MRAALVIVAAGSGSRVGATGPDGVPVNKVLLGLGDTTVLGAGVRTAMKVDAITRIVVVIRPEDRDLVTATLSPILGPAEALLVDGGETRHGSEFNALTALAAEIESGEIDVVAIHDAARPLAAASLFAEVIDAPGRRGGAVPVVELPGLIGRGLEPVEAGLVGVQTPQAFRAGPLLEAYRLAADFDGTDTAAVFAAHCDLEIAAVPSSATNLKVTWPGDVAAAERLA